MPYRDETHGYSEVMKAALRDHTERMIIETAAQALDERGDASMADIADAAGVGRATLYRYFPSRDLLLQAIGDTALDELTGRLADARVDTIPVTEAIARLTRAFISAGSKYVALMRTGHKPVDPAEVDRRIGTPLRELFDRGIATGELRGDVPSDVLLTLFGGLLEAAIKTQPGYGVEQASAAVLAVFLTGAGPQVLVERV